MVCLAVASPASTQHHRPPEVATDEVRFQTSCKPTVARMFDRGVGLLHVFSYAAALDAFRLVAHSDVDCAMAFWGAALANWGVWHTTGSEAALLAGRQALASAAHARHTSAREQAFVEAVAARFDGLPGDHIRGGQAYERAMAGVRARYPDDAEAALFAALALIERPERQAVDALANRRRAWASLWSMTESEHPGLTHYLMLAADGAAANELLLETATARDALATTTPYTLHVPSHVYVAVGRWDRAIEANLRSADAARQHGLADDELHALDTLVYSLLQAGWHGEATAIARRVSAVDGRIGRAGTRAANARLAQAAIPARIALERGAWATAAQLPLVENPGSAATLTRLARALGAARHRRPAQARVELAALGSVDASLAILRQVAIAWTLLAEGHQAMAIAALERAVQQQTAAGTIDVAFALLVPPREALAEMLLAIGRGAEALDAFTDALEETPGRRRSLYGAAMAARKIGRLPLAQSYFSRIAQLGTPPQPPDDSRRER